jgi:N-ethylmaleimide reductase
MIEPRATSARGGDDINTNAPFTNKLFRKKFKRTFISAGSYNLEDAKKAIDSNEVDVGVFGRIFIILSIVISIKKLLLILFKKNKV